MTAFSYVGAALTWCAFQEACGNGEITKIYKIWVDHIGPELIAHRGVEMAGRLLSWLTEMLAITILGSYITGQGHIGPGYGYMTGDGVSETARIVSLTWAAMMFFTMCKGNTIVPQPTPFTRLCVDAIARLEKLIPRRKRTTDSPKIEIASS